MRKDITYRLSNLGFPTLIFFLGVFKTQQTMQAMVVCVTQTKLENLILYHGLVK